MTFNKKQMQPLIDKYQINPETNKLFQKLIEMFDGQSNYQLWAVKAIFSQTTNIGTIEVIKDWIEKYPSAIKSLSKQNIVSYSTKSAFEGLLKEMRGIEIMSLIKDSISKFNTDQRKLLSEYLFKKEYTPMEVYEKSNMHEWAEIFGKFEKLSFKRRQNFYKSYSAVRSVEQLMNDIKQSIKRDYEWDREDLLAYVENNTPDCNVVYDKNNVVILNVPSFSSSHKLGGNGRTQWCICRESHYFTSYVTSKKDCSQYFLFDFSRKETDVFSHIGFTVSMSSGIVQAQTGNNEPMINPYRQKNESLSISMVLEKLGLKTSDFMKLNKKPSYKWTIEDVLKLIAMSSNNFKLAMEKDNKVVVEILNSSAITNLVGHTFIRTENFPCDQYSNTFLLMDFNRKYDEDTAIVAMSYRKDMYGTLSLSYMSDIYGADITKAGHLAKVGLETKDFLERTNIDPSIMLHKLIDENDQIGAIKLIEEEGDKLDVNFEFNKRMPIFSAMNFRMYDLFEKIMNHPKFNPSIQDGFGETLLQSLTYLYGSTDVTSTEEETKTLAYIIEKIMSVTKNFNNVDMNNDTALNIACEFPKAVWIVDKLARMKEVNVNIVNDFECDCIGQCIRQKNLEALKILGQREDIKITSTSEELAKFFGVNLKDYIKPNKNFFNEPAMKNPHGEFVPKKSISETEDAFANAL